MNRIEQKIQSISRWNKVIVIFVSLLVTFSVTWAFDIVQKYMNAASVSYTSGGNVTGRINIAPSNLNANNLLLRKGDKYYLKTKNPLDNSDLGWIIIGEAAQDNVFITMTTEAIAHTNAVASSPPAYVNPDSIVFYKDSFIKPIIDSFNATLTACSEDMAFVAPRSTALIENILYKSAHTAADWSTSAFLKNASISDGTNYETGNKAYTLFSNYDLTWSSSVSGVGTMTSYGNLQNADISFSEPFWDGNQRDGGNKAAGVWLNFIENGSRAAAQYDSGRAVRPALNVSLKDHVVFAVSKGSQAGMAKVNDSGIGSGVLWTAAADHQVMKLRIKNPNNPLTISFTGIENKNGQTITKTIKDSTIYVKANAQGTNTTVSALIFKNNSFYAYMPLEPASGLKNYEFNTTGLEPGSYKIGLVNEVYSDNDMAPAYSSEISAVQSLEILAPLSISATAKTNLIYKSNVNNGDIVATYTTSNGVAPITTSLVSDTSVAGHENDYQLFTSENGNVKVNTANGLNAGDYYFKINAIDANGDPLNGVNSDTVHISVSKTNLTAAFNTPSETKKSISEAATAWSETATGNPSTGTKITYSVSGGDISLISIDADTGVITYTGNGAFGKVKIKATADDDPSTGNDNYNSAFAEKEIVIYRAVDGSVVPHSNSSNTSTPTFTASDSNVKANGIIGTIHGTLGTPDTIGGSTTTYKYGLKSGVGDANFFSVNANTGEIKTTANLGVKNYSITVTVSDNWSTKEIPVTINVGVSAAEDLKFYENSSSNVVINTKSAKATDTNVSVYATVRGSSNTNPVTYRIEDGSANVIEVNPSSGAVTIHGVGTVTIVAEKQGAAGQANATARLTFTVTAGTQNFIYTDNAGNELPKTGSQYRAVGEVYERNKTFQLYTAGNPTGSTVTYQLKAGSPTDVISVDSTGLVHILNASLNNQMGNVIVQATSHDPTGNYSDSTIELPINITKANQTISFAGITYAANGTGSVSPVINEQDLSSNDGGVQVNDTDYYITIDNSINTSIAWTNNGVDIEYNYSGNGIDIPLHVEKTGNRNYNKAEADGIMHIMGPDESTLAINRPGRIIYGDHFEIKSLQDDFGSSNVQYSFEIDNATYISNPAVNGNKAEFDALKYSGTTNTNIKVTRTADGETPLSKTISVQVLPKAIEIVIDNKEKYKGEQNPTLTYQNFRNQLVSWNGVQDVIQENDIKLSTTAKTDSSASTYPIKGDANSLNRVYPNYSFTFKEGTLTIKEDNIEDDWYHLELDDGNNTAYTGIWTNQNVNIISDHNEYINMSLDQSTWNPTQVTVSREGESNQSFWMKKNSGAITKEKQEIIRIDKTAPKVKNIKAKDTNNKLQDIINKLSGGIFFKPGTAFEITTSDAKDDLKVSGTREIAYKVYKIETQARSGDELIKDGTLTVTNEKASITISETVGTYKVCVTPRDNAGNTNTESCHEVELKKIDVDVDGDGKPDFNDPDGDGCPDLNIKWKVPNDETKWIVINGDRNYDGIPDLNVDSDGDGKPDLNIDTDNDGKPDLNLVILKKNEWKPTKCVKVDIDNEILEEYCTGTSTNAVINVDTDDDGIPNINIDTNGDLKADINIDTDKDNTANTNLSPINVWQPNKDYTYQKFTYDTMKIEPLLNIDSDGDGRPDINIDLDDDGNPDINIDVNGDNIPDTNIDSTGDGNPDINIDTDGDGKPDENIVEIKEWKPNKNVDGDVLYDTMDFSEQEEPEKPEKPIDPVKANDTSVKGNYYPGDNVGGAMTGDETNLVLTIGLMLLGLGITGYQAYRYKKDTFQ